VIGGPHAGGGTGVAHMVAALRTLRWGLRTAVAVRHTAAALHTAATRMGAGEAVTTAKPPLTGPRLRRRDHLG
jgi:hypothetical protein